MSTHQKTQEKFDQLRQKAEKLIQSQAGVVTEGKRDILEIVHELRIHQAELEIQNEELQLAQQEISDLHRKFEDLYEFAPCGYLTLSPQGIITQANLMAVKILKADRQHLLCSSVTNFLAQGHDAQFLLKRKQAAETGKKQSVELLLKRENDQQQWIQANIEADLDKNGQAIQWRVVLIDITSQKQDREAFRQKSIEMEALFNGTRLLIEENSFEDNARKIFDICREITGAKSGYITLLSDDGAESEELFLESGGFSSDVKPELSMPVRGLRAEAYRLGKVAVENNFSTSKWMKFMPKGHIDLKNVLFGPLKDTGKTVGLIGLANKESDFNKSDIRIVQGLSELAAVALKQSNTRKALKKEKSREQLIQSQKIEAIGTLAGGIAHDFNNMLGIITGNISYALSQIDNNEDLHEVLCDAHEGAKQAQHLTQQLLTFAKGGEPIKKAVSFNQFVKNSAEFVSRGTKCKCEFKLADDLLPVEIDSGQFNQVIGNLIINANQAMPNGGVITIRTKNIELETHNKLSLPAGRYIKLTIEDQGIGISAKHLLNIFDPYFSTKQKGSGLGLATTYSIIKRHEGQIVVYSEVEKGTVFHIYLATSFKEANETDEHGKSEHIGQGKILIMDDQKPILKMIGCLLNKMGYEAALVTDGSQAVETYKEAQIADNPFDLVILDLTVPGGMGGAKTIIELLKIDPKIKALVSSGYSNDPIMSNYEDYGFCGVLPKPYTKGQLAEVLDNIFAD